jgi:predicted anti-sigma-YlaC factor YlaD
MSETLHLECARAQGLLALHVDGDLGADDSAWLHGHLTDCAKCRAALAAFAEIDSELSGWGERLSWRNPPRGDAREQLVSRLGAPAARRRVTRWIPVAAAAIAAGIALLVTLPRHTPPVETSEQTGFVEIPYLAPPDPHENTTVVRIQIRVATLIAVGYRVTADPDAIVPADVLVGEDGRAHAVRVPADVGLNGTGD